jgi:peptidoglycan hydrolase CwlO-like protein
MELRRTIQEAKNKTDKAREEIKDLERFIQYNKGFISDLEKKLNERG